MQLNDNTNKYNDENVTLFDTTVGIRLKWGRSDIDNQQPMSNCYNGDMVNNNNIKDTALSLDKPHLRNNFSRKNSEKIWNPSGNEMSEFDRLFSIIRISVSNSDRLLFCFI